MNNKYKSKQALKMLVPIVVLVLVISISFAVWLVSRSQEGINLVDTLKCLDISLTDITTEINLNNEYPIPNSEGMQKEPYTFSVKNNCDSFINVNITLESLGISTLNSSYVRASLNEKGKLIDNSRVLTDYVSATPTIAGATSYILKEDMTIEPNNEISYDLRLWLDEDATFEQAGGKSFNSKIVVIASPKAMPIHLTINLSADFAGSYNTSLGGAIWNNKLGALEIGSLTSEKTTINLSKADASSAVNLATYIKGLSNADGVYNEPETDWRYEGKKPNNYVAFNGELWRIIGVFEENTHGRAGESLVKIIRDESIGGLVWSKTQINIWATSSLYNLLNQYYYNGINETVVNFCYVHNASVKGNCDFIRNGITNGIYRDMIENVTWRLGGTTTSINSKTAYEAERGEVVYAGGPTSVTGYIGLMYPSDYGYSPLASSCPRSTIINSYSSAGCSGETWLNKGLEWLMSPSSTSSTGASSISTSCNVNTSDSSRSQPVRPSLYLKSGVQKLSGEGTADNPYIIINGS